ncbi:MAG: hypothetical protein BM555_06115 [Crocinitomix sp. MedPE-SWsnd]|nr:MAG: hypothetical protein BM555_06115 [Crocinitomix sp. MedPE-SWsnd]
MNHTFTIYGWGLAGCTLAWELWKQKVNFKVVYKNENHSSRVAAGLVNPIVFKRLTKSWQADVLLPFAKEFYEDKEELIGRKFLSNKPISRVFASIEEQNSWSSIHGDERFEKYISPITELKNQHIKTPFHVGKVESIGHLDVNLFLNESMRFLESQEIEFVQLENYNANDAEKAIYCEGADVLENKYFGYLPMRPTHGDVLIIRSENLQLDEIVNKNLFILPLGDNLFKVGATYNWKMKQPIPTQEGKNELIEKLEAFTTFEYEIVKHQAGLRPTVSDRRPLLGRHPKEENKFIFNGLGTKGVMIAPYYANQLCGHLLKGTAIDDEVNIERHLKHFNA